ncbi:2-amino-4-hydroxy-6-hydroxymethyldihydropteridine diphosphokinase [Candidatus Omnitrophota bacterium]
MARAFLGVGSNVGNRNRNIQSSITLLKEHNIQIRKVSSVIETDPVGGPPQRKFLNAAVEIKTTLSPQELLKTLKQIERKIGRKKSVKNGPRRIDLDILLYENKLVYMRNLTIPHPRMLERDFVMKPLHEIAPSVTRKLLKS